MTPNDIDPLSRNKNNEKSPSKQNTEAGSESEESSCNDDSFFVNSVISSKPIQGDVKDNDIENYMAFL